LRVSLTIDDSTALQAKRDASDTQTLSQCSRSAWNSKHPAGDHSLSLQDAGVPDEVPAAEVTTRRRPPPQTSQLYPAHVLDARECPGSLASRLLRRR